MGSQAPHCHTGVKWAIRMTSLIGRGHCLGPLSLGLLGICHCPLLRVGCCTRSTGSASLFIPYPERSRDTNLTIC